MRRLIVGLLFVAALSLSGCSKAGSFVDPPPDQPCTAFGCHPKQGNVFKELGGIVLFGVLLGGVLGGVVKRMTE